MKRRNRSKLVPLVALLALTACWQAQVQVSRSADLEFSDPATGGIKQAAFDLGCTTDQMQVVDLGSQMPWSGTIGVSGCGKKATYKYVQGAGWVNNTLGGAAGK